MEGTATANSFFTTDAGEPFPTLPADSGQYNDVISLNMAEYARLAYFDQQQIGRILKAKGFVKLSLFKSHGTFAYLAEHPGYQDRKGFSILAFRGTENDYADIITDITVLKRSIGDTAYRVHGGFLTALNEIWGVTNFAKSSKNFTVQHYGSEGLINALLDTNYDNDLYITGHSMGAALADLAAYKLVLELQELAENGETVSGITALYTIGGPRTMGNSLAEMLDEKKLFQHYRVVNGADLVPRTPLFFMGFRHTGQSVNLKHNGEKEMDMSIWGAFIHIWLKQLLVFILLFVMVQLGIEQVEQWQEYTEIFGKSAKEPWILNVAAAIIFTLAYLFLFVFLPKILSWLPGDMSRWWGNKLLSDHFCNNYRTKLLKLALTETAKKPEPVKVEPNLQSH